MIPGKLRLYMAGLVAVLLGMPLSDRAFAATDDAAAIENIVTAAIGLAAGIADAASNS